MNPATSFTSGVDHAQIATLADISRYHARVRPDSVALSFEGRHTTYADLDRHTNQVARALLAAGAFKGDRICYVGKNCDHYFELLLGAAKIGVVMAPMGWRLAPREIAYVINDTRTKFLFVGPESVGAIREVESDLPAIQMTVAMEGGVPGWLAFERWRDEGADIDPGVTISEGDIALQLYTSGTTGNPKGAMLRHSNLLGGRRLAAEAKLSWNEWGPDDVSLVAMPVGHIGGSGWGIVGLYNGAMSVVAREFDPMRVLDFIENDRISKMFMVPAALQIVVRQPRAREVDYSRLKYILYGASPIPLDLLRECIEVFGCGFCQQYGMTETCGTVVYLPPEDHDTAGNARMRSAGKAMPGVELKVIDSAGNVLSPNSVGEVAVRSVANMAGYWNLPEATLSTIDSEGWLRTGDAGYLDEDGYLFIQDRLKDMIISGGENVYPAEVENAIYGHPDVAEVAVIGVPDEKWGEAVKAIVVPKAGRTVDPENVIAFARLRIAGFKAPKSVDVVDALPRNASGKILRRHLREPFWAGQTRRVN